ncbi:neuronal acetylcholine receptor subunit alpha-7-like [Argopecten irradians]|uniref:neuronal acetylcholine receptor subunit alpha-7-like n=1 Tax=Argopecten irradians TaxID=31199 RepID=UPI00371F33AD
MVFFCVRGQVVPGRSGTMDDWIRLTDTLFTNYSKHIYPVYNFTDTLSVDTSMLLFSIIDFDELSGVITLSASISLVWTDYRLQWNSSDYGGIEFIQLNSSKIWKPNVYLISTADELSKFGSDEFDVSISSSGVCGYNPGKLLRSTCSVDMTKFPVDTQSCHMQLVLWGKTPNVKLTFSRTTFIMMYYTQNGEWDITQTSVSDYMGYGSPSTTLDFTLQITRRHIYFIVSLTIPILLLCFLNPFVFLLPASSGERISYTITMFLSLAVYMTLMGDNLPKVSENMAGMSYFLLVSLIYSSVLILLTIFTLRCEATEDVSEFPIWLRRLTQSCSKFKSLKMRSYARRVKDAEEPIETKEPVAEVDTDCLCVKHRDIMRFIDHSLFATAFLFNLIITIWFLCFHYA